MISKAAAMGACDACTAFGVDLEKLALAMPAPAGGLGGIWNAVKGFGAGQLGHVKDLVQGGIGVADSARRAQAMQSLKGLLPSAGLLGGAYLLNRRNDKQPQPAY